MLKKLVETLVSVALVSGFPGLASADGPATGCFERDYTDAHLTKHRIQIVDRMVLRVYQQQGGAKVANMWVKPANQGHVAASGDGGQHFSQFLFCWTDNGENKCAVECDGGTMQVTKQNAKGLTFRTKYLIVGDAEECGGAVDLAEVQGQYVSYRLNRVSDAVCEREK